MNKKIQLVDGQHVIGFDFGRKRNHVVFCRLQVLASHPNGFRIEDWGTLDYPNATLGTIITEMHDIARSNHPSVCGQWFVLETQPSGNSRCLAISHAWQALLLANNHPADRILFTHARTKFTALDSDGICRPAIREGGQNAPARYRQRKRWATNLCLALLGGQPDEFRLLFHSLKKKDDFSDAFLYAAAFIVKHKPENDVFSVSTTTVSKPPVIHAYMRSVPDIGIEHTTRDAITPVPIRTVGTCGPPITHSPCGIPKPVLQNHTRGGALLRVPVVPSGSAVDIDTTNTVSANAN